MTDERTGTALGRVAVASCAGTTIEFYDFFLYGTAAALVFPKVFFPALGAAAGSVASLATLGVAFVARPVGAVVCGHFGDRLGRKNTLVATLVLMGVATVVIGLLPPASVAGAAGPILLTVLRFLQGFAVGGEWAGATLLAAENAPPGKRGLYAVFPQLGPALGFALASGTFLVVDLAVGEGSPAFLSYGWRIPFLASAVLVLIGLYVRLSVTETYGIAYGPVGAYLPELFRTAYRYTGAGIAYNLGGILGGAIAPLVAAALAAAHGVFAVGVLLGVLGVLSLLSAVALRPGATTDRSPATHPKLEYTP
ncbi:Sugar transporter [Amycolatopsis australiensis]|uniref:Sugar transporter n=1 Tax=Amycolatopsis australiensis TaxID=546364 RepID=A0A1K1RGL2_9PSEU|nr:MFS transporter [Amycolatopsis australiensis]SFW71081.1 Sugar transporter [Amycolatopsis australiensis]